MTNKDDKTKLTTNQNVGLMVGLFIVIAGVWMIYCNAFVSQSKVGLSLYLTTKWIHQIYTTTTNATIAHELEHDLPQYMAGNIQGQGDGQLGLYNPPQTCGDMGLVHLHYYSLELCSLLSLLSKLLR